MTDFRVTMFATDYSTQPAAVARAVEDRGFESIFFPEHTHIPADRKTPWPGGPDLPKHYWHTHDPFVAMSAAPTVRERLKLVTGICLVTEHEPIALAKTVASLNLISGGRTILGIGAGWNREEMENHGASYPDRWAIMRERVAAMRTIWTEEEPEYHGEFVNFDRLWSYPKPVQPGGPKILLGAQFRWSYKRVVEYGWMPVYGRTDVIECLAGLRQAAAGREMATIELSVFGTPGEEQAVES